MTLRKQRVLEIEKGSARSHSVENSFFGKGYGPVVKPDSRLNDITYALGYLARCIKISNF